MSFHFTVSHPPISTILPHRHSTSFGPFLTISRFVNTSYDSFSVTKPPGKRVTTPAPSFRSRCIPCPPTHPPVGIIPLRPSIPFHFVRQHYSNHERIIAPGGRRQGKPLGCTEGQRAGETVGCTGGEEAGETFGVHRGQRAGGNRGGNRGQRAGGNRGVHRGTEGRGSYEVHRGKGAWENRGVHRGPGRQELSERHGIVRIYLYSLAVPQVW